jgi:hypothetical protein
MIQHFALVLATLGLGAQSTAPQGISSAVIAVAVAPVRPTSKDSFAGDTPKQSQISRSLDTSLRNVVANGDLPAPIIRTHLLRVGGSMQRCYDQAVARRPNLEGTVTVSFLIRSGGRVGTIDARGISPEVSSCIARVISAVAFPSPRGGGGVQVNTALRFSPTSPPR